MFKSLINKRWHAFRCGNWILYEHYKAKVKLELPRAKRIWSEKQSQMSRGLWTWSKDQQGSRCKNPWSRLLQEFGSYEILLTRLTEEFREGFNGNEDVELLELSREHWPFLVSPGCVFEQLSKLNGRKAAGPDFVPPRLLKAGASFLSGPLSCLFNMSIEMRIFPSCFKQAKVCPIPKSNCPHISDFRPIPLLSCISKVFERIILLNVKSQLFRCFGAHQHAYRPLSSTTTALIEVCEYVSRGLDSRNFSYVNMLCLDLSKAFNITAF